MSMPRSASDPAQRPFSKHWVWISVVAFIVAELIVGGLLGELIFGRMLSISTSFLLQGLLNMSGYLLGGFAVGVLSPGRRILEPAAGAAATLVLIAISALFVPYRYMGYANSGLIVACVLAAGLGAAGAYAGERITGNLPEVPHSPQDTLR